MQFGEEVKQRYCFNPGCRRQRGKKNEVWCFICRRVAYCSKKCQQQNDSQHKPLCFPTLPERLRAVCYARSNATFRNEYEKAEYSVMNNTNLSTSHYMSVFKIYGDGCDSNRVHCVICDTVIVESMVWNITKQELTEGLEECYVLHNSRQWSYYTCQHCTREGLRLCPTFLKSNEKCFSERWREFWKVSLLLKTNLDYDIVSHVMSLTVLTSPCIFCLYYYKYPHRHSNKKYLL